ncbi:efflux RND transporter permease subunit [Rhodoblastus acidophilus]|uniref:Efflux RND transporter permease subunit n=1 Tax=Candidatus Rhodoblastus alkanivorans TaxID=2954117 RepID=A0ABS9Z4Q5_9HYPH|nr:efflux RND transporter permease subunit [Candidatus Rhodoblastus alkanivorans]MCI4677655.1 efflux RND transporter permease subunit [Candidatus Rhodoblastus alkanivorans]MCI4682613.1 efflux RND transporter permease subunit [Candidatus Rhodoblastus alkanivorans]MDI4639919.1 efflux RND transporter permease subunit [Rhodoblastus acidophilus]
MGAFTDLFIRRPVLSVVVSLLILLVGAQAGFKLQIRQYPALSSATITITTTYPGANADLVKGFITTPIEQAVASAEGVDTLVSNSQQNVSTVTLNLRLNANADRAMTDVLAKVAQVKQILPKEANDPVVVKQTGQGTALLYMSFNSDTLTAAQITDYITRVVQPRLQTIDGVASAQIIGGQNFAMRIWLDPDRMAARGVTAADIRNALIANNFTSAAGQIKGDFTQTSINALTSLETAKAFAQLVVFNKGDALVKLGDVARIDLGPQSVDSSAVFDGLKAVFIGIYATPTANPLTVIQDVRAAFPSIQAALPAGVKGAIAYDATEFIRASIHEVAKTLLEAGAIVIVVIFLFLGDLRSTLIPIVTIPLSLIGVMIFMLLLGYSINLLTLLAFVLAIGLVVDDAIVVVENIYRHIEEGYSPKRAAMLGAREIALPVVGMTITLAAVYAPIGFVGGLSGALFKEFAFTLAGAVVVSGFIALTLSPMMCSKLLKPHERHAPGAARKGRRSMVEFLDDAFESLRRRYERLLHRTLNFRALTILVLVGVLALTGLLYVSTPRELAPEEDQGLLLTMVKTPQYANLDYLETVTSRLQKNVFDKVPEKDHVFVINGSQGVNTGMAGMLLKPWDERKRSQSQILQSLQPLLADQTGAQVFAFALPSLPGSTGGPPVQFVIRTAGDYRTLAGVLDQMLAEARKSGLFIFTDGDLKFDTPQFEVKIDAAKASSLGVTMQDIGATLATFLGGNYVNRFNLNGRSYEVIPQAPRDFRLTSDWLMRYQLRTASGALIPLSTVVSIEQKTQPNALMSFQQLNAATLSGVPFPGHTLGEALGFLERKAKEILPEGYSYDFQGESRQFVQEGDTLALAFVFSLIVIYLVLAAQFESFRDPFIVLIALPTSMFGALLPLNILGVVGAASINIYTQIGLMTLIGLISKHGILMVDFANQMQRREGFNPREAIEHAAGVRLRPILMTTAAMVVGMIPLIVASGAGARSRAAIGMVIGAGMSVGTIFTLFVTPAVYSLLARKHDSSELLDEAGPLAPEKARGEVAEV